MPHSDHDILDAYFTARGNLEAAAATLNLSLAQLVAILASPPLAHQVAAWKELLLTQQHLEAATYQSAAAQALRDAIASAWTPIEKRRAATTLARLATSMSASPRSKRTAPPAPPRSPDTPPSLPTAPLPSHSHTKSPAFPPITLDDVLAEIKNSRRSTPPHDLRDAALENGGLGVPTHETVP